MTQEQIEDIAMLDEIIEQIKTDTVPVSTVPMKRTKKRDHTYSAERTDYIAQWY